MTRPSLVFYCQHSLGFGHLARTCTLAAALSNRFRVTVWCGGPLPPEFARPRSFDLIQLPPLVMNDEGRLVSLEPRYSVEESLVARGDVMLRSLAVDRPAVVVIELFPFGRRKFTQELLPVLDAAQSASPRPVVVCSLRDILVARGQQQRDYDERARVLADRYFDAVLVHADPSFARLDECFRPVHPMRTPVHYTGFVTNRSRPRPDAARNGILVSGGGGRFARSLYMTAIEAHHRLTRAPQLRVVAGPLCEASTWEALVAAASQDRSIQIRRTVPDLSAAMALSRLSISQCGYNTALDIVQARVPALVVPFAEGGESEQMDRARRLAALGVVRTLPGDRLDAPTLAAVIEETLRFQPAQPALDLNGADRTTNILGALVDGRKPVDDRHSVAHERLA